MKEGIRIPTVVQQMYSQQGIISQLFLSQVLLKEKQLNIYNGENTVQKAFEANSGEFEGITSRLIKDRYEF